MAYALERAGWTVFLPMFGAHSRVDPTRPRWNGSVLPHASNTNNVRISYVGEVDAFGLWCPPLQTAYLLPIGDAPEQTGHLRLAPPANNQRTGIRYAADYEIRPVG